MGSGPAQCKLKVPRREALEDCCKTGPSVPEGQLIVAWHEVPESAR